MWLISVTECRWNAGLWKKGKRCYYWLLYIPAHHTPYTKHNYQLTAASKERKEVLDTCIEHFFIIFLTFSTHYSLDIKIRWIALIEHTQQKW